MSCCCIPLQFALMLVLTFAPCAGGVSFHQQVQILHWHMWWSAPAATCTGGVFPSSSWRKYSTCTCGGHHPLQLALVVFFLPTTGANTLLALCGGGCMWWYIHIYIYNHHHIKNTTTASTTTTTTQCKLPYMRISKCASALRKNTTSASCDDHHECKRSICAS